MNSQTVSILNKPVGSYRAELYRATLEEVLSEMMDSPIELCETRTDYVCSIDRYVTLDMYPILYKLKARQRYERSRDISHIYIPKPTWYLPKFRQMMIYMERLVLLVWFSAVLLLMVFNATSVK